MMRRIYHGDKFALSVVVVCLQRYHADCVAPLAVVHVFCFLLSFAANAAVSACSLMACANPATGCITKFGVDMLGGLGVAR